MLDEAVCISLGVNAPEKGMNPFVLPPSRAEFFRLGLATSIGEGKCRIQVCFISLQKIDFVSHPTRSEGVGQIYTRVTLKVPVLARSRELSNGDPAQCLNG